MQIRLIGIRDRHQITVLSVIKRLSLYEFTLWGRDFLSLSVLERVGIMEVFLKKIYENFVATLETVRNREESVLERCAYRGVRLYSFLPLIIM